MFLVQSLSAYTIIVHKNWVLWWTWVDGRGRCGCGIWCEETGCLSGKGRFWILFGWLLVDKAKIDVIEKLPPLVNVKGIRSFLGHVGFYRRYIKDFSKIAKPLSNLHNKDTAFIFDEECLQAFNILKTRLVSSPVMTAPDWGQEFELMCDVGWQSGEMM